MITYHPDIQVVSGTDWTVNGVLYDAAGNPLDVTNCTLVWGLLDPDGNSVLPLDADVQIAKTDPVNGAISITLSDTDTALRPGRYTDALQVTEGQSTDVFWIGNILVGANPFNVINGIVEQPVPPSAPTPAPDDSNIVVIPQWWWWQGGPFGYYGPYGGYYY